MPLKGERKLAYGREYRTSRTPAYHRWLYARRMLRAEEAERFKEAIEQSLLAANGVEASWILEEALRDAESREIEVGNRWDHSRDESYWDPEPGPGPRRGEREAPEGDPTTVLTIEWEADSSGDWLRRFSRALARRISEQPMTREAHVRTFATVNLPGEEGGAELDDVVGVALGDVE